MCRRLARVRYARVATPLLVAFWISSSAAVWPGGRCWAAEEGKPAAAAAPSGEPAANPRAQAVALRLPDGREAVTVPVAFANEMPFVRVRLNGADAGYFLVDTGANVTVVANAVAQRLKLTWLGPTPLTVPGGRSMGWAADLASVEIGEASAGRTVAVVIDSSELVKRLGFDLAGVIGSDLLGGQPFTLDLRAATLTFHDARHFAAPADGATGLTAHRIRLLSNGSPAAVGRLEGHEAWFAVDTGWQGDFTVQPAFVGLHPDLVEGKAWRGWGVGTGAGGLLPIRLTQFKSLEFLGGRWEDLRGSVAQPAQAAPPVMEYSAGAIVGLRQMRGGRFTFDYASGRLWAERPPREPADEMARRLGGPGGRDLSGLPALAQAALWGRADVVAALLAQGADVDAADRNGVTAVSVAACEGHVEIVRSLLAAGARPDPRVLASLAIGSRELADTLLDAKPDVTAAADPNGWTALHFAAAGQGPEVVGRVLDAGANVDARTKIGETPLIVAAGRGDPRVVALLLSRGADVGAKDANGMTALLAGVRAGQAESVQLLLERGARPDDAAGSANALTLAAAWNRPDVVRLLLAHGADPARPDPEGKTPRDDALRYGNLSVLKVLLEDEATRRATKG